MRATFPVESNISPAPGIVPEPALVHEQPTAAAGRAAGRAADRAGRLPAGHAKPRSILLARLLGVLRGDKHMVVAYPPPIQSPTKER
jgi:hypothetical protein